MTRDTKVTLEFVVRFVDLDDVLQAAADSIGSYVTEDSIVVSLGDPDSPHDDGE
jgi:hypothetical protein